MSDTMTAAAGQRIGNVFNDRRPSPSAISPIKPPPISAPKSPTVDAAESMPPPVSSGYPEPPATPKPTDPFHNKFAGKVVG